VAAQTRLMQMLIHSASTHTLLSWADPADRQLEGLSSFGYWRDMARTVERGCFDAVFFADSPATHAVYKDSPTPSVQYGVSWPNHDPMPLVAVMAAATEWLGFGVTLSTTGTTPYLATRRISTLDYLTRGRVAWNIVTGFSRAEHDANGSAASRNKMRALQLLAAHGVPVPPTVMASNASDLRELVELVGGVPVLIKLLTPSEKPGVIVCETLQSMEAALEAVLSMGHNLLVQRYVRRKRERIGPCSELRRWH